MRIERKCFSLSSFLRINFNFICCFARLLISRAQKKHRFFFVVSWMGPQRTSSKIRLMCSATVRCDDEIEKHEEKIKWNAGKSPKMLSALETRAKGCTQKSLLVAMIKSSYSFQLSMCFDFDGLIASLALSSVTNSEGRRSDLILHLSLSHRDSLPLESITTKTPSEWELSVDQTSRT